MKLKKKSQRFTSGLIILLAGLLFGFLLFRLFFLPFTVTGNSMQPNFNEGEKVFIIKYFDPKFNDVVLIESPVEEDKVLLRRIIAGPKDQLEIKNRIVYVNKKKVYQGPKAKKIFPAPFSYRDNLPPLKLKENQFFLLSDNYSKSFDSRTFGLINRKSIIGKVFRKY